MADLLAERLAYDGELPMSWRCLGAFPAWPMVARLNQTDEELLAVIADQEQGRKGFVGDDDDPTAQRLAEVESKLNLLVDLVGQLLRQNMLLAEPRPLRFNADGIIWGRVAGEAVPEVDSVVMVELFPSVVIPRPLSLPGRVMVVDEQEIHVAFEGIGEALADMIHKFIFRDHRRAVALARAARNA